MGVNMAAADSESTGLDRTEAAPMASCAYCGGVLPPQQRGGQPKRYCSRQCQQEAWEREHPRIKTPAQLRLLLGRVKQAADPAWLELALAAVRRCAEAQAELICDDVWAHGLERTREDRALGPVMMKAKRMGWIERTDRYRPSVRSHGSGKPVWKSKLYREGR